MDQIALRLFVIIVLEIESASDQWIGAGSSSSPRRT